MSNAATVPPVGPYSPWSPFVPPADLPDDLKFVYNLAADAMLVAVGFCSFPERFTCSPEQLSSWHGSLKRAVNELAGYIVNHEAMLRAEAPEVLFELQRAVGIVGPLRIRLASLISSLDAKPADPSDASLVGLVNALRDDARRNHERLAHDLLDGITVSPDSLDGLRAALSEWAGRRRQDAAQPDAAAKTPKRRRGRKPVQEPHLTSKETEAMHLVGEHKGNVTAAANAAGITRQAMGKRYAKANQKLGKLSTRKPKTRAHPTDGRGQSIVPDPTGQRPPKGRVTRSHVSDGE